MVTVAEDYKRAVQAMRPTARMQYIRRDGFRWCRIVDGNQILVDAEPTHESAWREAEWHLLRLNDA